MNLARCSQEALEKLVSEPAWVAPRDDEWPDGALQGSLVPSVRQMRANLPTHAIASVDDAAAGPGPPRASVAAVQWFPAVPGITWQEVDWDAMDTMARFRGRGQASGSAGADHRHDGSELRSMAVLQSVVRKPHHPGFAEVRTPSTPPHPPPPLTGRTAACGPYLAAPAELFAFSCWTVTPGVS